MLEKRQWCNYDSVVMPNLRAEYRSLIQIWVSDAQREALRVAADRGASTSDLVRRGLDLAIAEQDMKEHAHS